MRDEEDVAVFKRRIGQASRGGVDSIKTGEKTSLKRMKGKA